MKSSSGARRRQIPGSPFNVPTVVVPVEKFEPEDRVTHDQFGMGKVIEVEGDQAVLVQCGTRKVRVTAPFSKLFKL